MAGTSKKGRRVMSPEQVAAMKRREDTVLRERIKGKSWALIERETGISHPDRVFKRAIERDENADYRRAEAVRLEEMRLDDLQAGLWDRALSGEPRAVEVALKVLERRSRLVGLDFADLVSGQLVEVERAKVRVVATALAKVLDHLEVAPARKQEAVALFLGELRALDAPSGDGDS